MNGVVVRTLGTRVRPGVDRVQVDGVGLRAEAPVTVMLHKPAGYITAVSDPEGRPVVLSLLPKMGLPRLFPVGRLDWDTEGLLLLTNDGDLAHFLTHPRHGVAKVYHAKVKGRPAPEALRRLVHGVVCDGERLSAAAVSSSAHHARQHVGGRERASGTLPPGPPDVRGYRPPGPEACPRGRGPDRLGPAAARALAAASAGGAPCAGGPEGRKRARKALNESRRLAIMTP